MKLFLLIAVTIAIVSCQQPNEFNYTAMKECSAQLQNSICQESNANDLRMEWASEFLRINCEEFAEQEIYDCSVSTDSKALCGNAHSYLGDITNLLDFYNTNSCAPIAYNYGKCSPQCKDGLTALKNTLGCCANINFNGTHVPDAYRRLFSDRVWQACGVAPIDEDCEPQFTLASLNVVPTTAANCSNKEATTLQLNQAFCSLSYYNYVKDFIEQTNDRCAIYMYYANDVCSVDSNDTYCLATPNGLADDYGDYIAPLQACDRMEFSKQTCSDSCKDTLQQFVTQRGCCVNALYNSTFGTVTGGNQGYLSNHDVFTLCGVTPPPKECSLSATLNSGSMQLRSLDILFLLSTMMVIYIMSMI